VDPSPSLQVPADGSAPYADQQLEPGTGANPQGQAAATQPDQSFLRTGQDLIVSGLATLMIAIAGLVGVAVQRRRQE
jgi:hypothetical protein